MLLYPRHGPASLVACGVASGMTLSVAGVAVARRADAEDLGGHCHVLGPSCAHGFLAADRGHSTVLRSQESLDVSADDIAVASRLLGFPATMPRCVPACRVRNTDQQR